MPTTKIVKPYPFVYRDIDRQGEVRWRLRAPGRKTTTIKGVFGSAEFAANYRAAMEGEECRPRSIPNKPGTMAALARSYLHSAAFAELAPTTQRARRHLVEQFIDAAGHAPVAGLERRHVTAIMDKCAGHPGKARNMLSMLRVLIARAMDDGLIDSDPTLGIKRPKLSGRAGIAGQMTRSPDTRPSIP